MAIERLSTQFTREVAAEVRTAKGKHLILVEKRLESTPSVDIYRFQMNEGAPSHFTPRQ